MGRAADVILGAIGRLLWHLRLAAVVRHLGRRNPKVLLFHACEPEESPFTRGLDVNMPPEQFAALLDNLQASYRVIDLEELEGGDVPERAAVITFDDGYRSVLEHAAPLLAERGLPATVYLITEAVGNGNLVWVNELNWLLDRHADITVPIAAEAFGVAAPTTPAAVMRAAVHHYAPSTVDALLAELWRRVPTAREDVLADLDLYLSWDEVRSMQSAGFSFGSHTMHHPDLRALDDVRLAAEIDGSIAKVQRELGSCTSFAYPFGFADARVRGVAANRPLTSIMEVGGRNRGEWLRRTARAGIDESTAAGMFARLEVIEPLKARTRAVLAKFSTQG